MSTIKNLFGGVKFAKMSLILMVCAISISQFQCASPAPPEENTAPYTPPPLTDSSWEMISSPEEVGWSTQKLREAYQYAKGIQTAAVMVIFQDKVLYHWGDLKYKYIVHSCRKSFISALFGIHEAAGTIDTNKTMGELGIDDLFPLTELEKTATVIMLLQARSGIYIPAACESQSMADSRPERHSHAPGTFWYYNNWDFNVLGVILEQESGSTIFEELKNKIADPIGMEDFQVSDGSYQYIPQTQHPCYPFRMSARDMARFGLLFLRKGNWQGQQIISEDWIKESTSSYSDAYTNVGYGYMWWILVNGGDIPNHNINWGYSAQGYGGHYIMVLHDYDVVVVHRVNTDLGGSVNYTQNQKLLGLILDAKLN